MKQNTKPWGLFLTAVLTVVFLVAFLTACDRNAGPVRIYISPSSDFKTEYAVGEDFDPAGMFIYAEYPDGSFLHIPVAADMIAEWDSSAAGTVTAYVAYGGKFAAFTAEIVAAPEPVIYYTVIYYNGADVFESKTYAAGDCVIEPLEIPEKEGFGFERWLNGGDEPYVFGTPVNSDISLYAEFSPLIYTVTVTAESGGTADGGGGYPHGEKLVLTAEPGLGWCFEGFYIGGTKIDADDYAVTKNLVITAVFVRIVYTVNIAYEGIIDGGSKIDGARGYFYGEELALTPAPDGNHEFSGFFTSGGEFFDENIITRDIDLTAKFIGRILDVVFTKDGDGCGEIFEPEIIRYGDFFNIEYETAVSSNFVSWLYDGKDIPDNFILKGDYTVTAVFMLKTFVIS